MNFRRRKPIPPNSLDTKETGSPDLRSGEPVFSFPILFPSRVRVTRCRKRSLVRCAFGDQDEVNATVGLFLSLFGGRFAGARAAIAWHGTLSEMGMVVVSSTISAGPVAQSLSEEGKPTGDGGKALAGAFPRFADDFSWWVEAAKAQHARKKPPY